MVARGEGVRGREAIGKGDGGLFSSCKINESWG